MTDDWNAALLARMDASTRASLVYDALKKTGGLPNLRLIEYRCRGARCLLLDLVQTPDQVIVHQPSYKHSPKWYAEKWNDEGRAANSDGNRRSVAHTYDSGAAVNFIIQCDHISATIDKSDVEADIKSHRRVVFVRSDGTRYPEERKSIK